MGAWGLGLYDNDTAADLRPAWNLRLRLGDSPSEATAYLLRFFGIDPEEPPTHEVDFWVALADLQWKQGRLVPSVRDTALRVLGSSEFYDAFLPEDIPARKKVGRALEERLRRPPPEPKPVKPFEQHLRWKPGSLRTYVMPSGQVFLLHTLGTVSGLGYGEAPVCAVIPVSDQEANVKDMVAQAWSTTPAPRCFAIFVGGPHEFAATRLRYRGVAKEPPPTLPDDYEAVSWRAVDNVLASAFDVFHPQQEDVLAIPRPNGSFALMTMRVCEWWSLDKRFHWGFDVLEFGGAAIPSPERIAELRICRRTPFCVPEDVTQEEIDADVQALSERLAHLEEDIRDQMVSGYRRSYGPGPIRFAPVGDLPAGTRIVGRRALVEIEHRGSGGPITWDDVMARLDRFFPG